MRGSGNDMLWGNAGNDTLFGEAGNDLLTGGTGADVFLFVQSEGSNEWISDFDITQDKLRLFAAASLTQVTFRLVDGDVVLTWNEQTITLDGVTEALNTG